MTAKMTIIEGNSNDKDNVRAYMVKGESATSEWGDLTGDINDQTDLIDKIDTMIDEELDDYYKKSETYNKTEVDDKFKTITVTTPNTDLNDYTENGIYVFDVTPINIPSGHNITNGWLEVINESGGCVKQIWYRGGTINRNDSEIYVRTYMINQGWSNWMSYARYWSFEASNTEFTINIPHNNNVDIKSAFIFSKDWAGVVTIGNSTQLWSYEIGKLGSVSMTPTITNWTEQYVSVKLTFSELIYGGIKVIV